MITVYIKNLLTPLSFATLFICMVGCKKDTAVDPRDKYAGTYSVSFAVTERNFTNGKVANHYSSSLVTVDKGSVVNGVVLSSLSQYATALINDRFNIPAAIVKYTVNGRTWNLERNGLGSFDKSSFMYAYVDSGTISGQSIQITTIAKGVKQ